MFLNYIYTHKFIWHFSEIVKCWEIIWEPNFAVWGKLDISQEQRETVPHVTHHPFSFMTSWLILWIQLWVIIEVRKHREQLNNVGLSLVWLFMYPVPNNPPSNWGIALLKTAHISDVNDLNKLLLLTPLWQYLISILICPRAVCETKRNAAVLLCIGFGCIYNKINSIFWAMW